MKIRSWLPLRLACAVAALGVHTAHAQRASENVVASAEDAFGTKVGNDNVGLYDPRSARGFDPQLAGNVRIEGLYFDQQANFGSRLTRSTTMRIGLSAQSYPFPAPTGIADITLVMPAQRTVIATNVEYQYPVGQRAVSLELSTPLIAGKLGMVASFKGEKRFSDWRGDTRVGIGAVLFRWTPNDRFELIPFIYDNRAAHEETQPFILTGGTYLPPRVDRSVFFGQEWAERKSDDLDAGVLMRTTPFENWRLQAALFRSVQTRPENHVVFFRNTQPDGRANLEILAYPKHKAASTSGEVRASGVFTDGRLRHTIHLAVRGRDTERLFGGGDTENLGPARIGVYQPVAKPNYVFGTRDNDAVTQVSPGISYAGQWLGVGEFSVGLQKAFYHRAFGKLGAPAASTRSRPWLYNGTLALYPTKSLSVYGGYTRGMEEFGTAPETATNAGEPVPAAVTRQIDAGIRYRIAPGLSLVSGVFEVTKPYFDRNTALLFTDVGQLRHRGIEVSLAGKPRDDLTVVAGAVFLQARVSGLPVDQRLIGPVPPGTPPHIIRANLQYEIPGWRGLSVDAQVENNASQNANRLNTLRIPSSTVLSLGFRRPFKMREAEATFRFQVQNLFNSYAWTVDGASGRFSPIPPRRLLARLAVDF